MDLISLKAAAFDLIAKIELMQSELKKLNGLILEKMQKENAEPNATN
jgi:hypothetical protein